MVRWTVEIRGQADVVGAMTSWLETVFARPRRRARHTVRSGLCGRTSLGFGELRVGVVGNQGYAKVFIEIYLASGARVYPTRSGKQTPYCSSPPRYVPIANRL